MFRLEVVKNLYKMRFDDDLDGDITIASLRGKEGARVRNAYIQASKEYDIEWSGRIYRRKNWFKSDPVNRALSTANSCLYGICHAAIVTAGYSPSIGFIHTGKLLSYVYDIADLYKVEITIPLAFKTASEESKGLETRVRRACRQKFKEDRLLKRILPDIEEILTIKTEKGVISPGKLKELDKKYDDDEAYPGPLWNPEDNITAGGKNYSSQRVEKVEGHAKANNYHH